MGKIKKIVEYLSQIGKNLFQEGGDFYFIEHPVCGSTIRIRENPKYTRRQKKLEKG